MACFEPLIQHERIPCDKVYEVKNVPHKRQQSSKFRIEVGCCYRRTVTNLGMEKVAGSKRSFFKGIRTGAKLYLVTSCILAETIKITAIFGDHLQSFHRERPSPVGFVVSILDDGQSLIWKDASLRKEDRRISKLSTQPEEQLKDQVKDPNQGYTKPLKNQEVNTEPEGIYTSLQPVLKQERQESESEQDDTQSDRDYLPMDRGHLYTGLQDSGSPQVKKEPEDYYNVDAFAPVHMRAPRFYYNSNRKLLGRLCWLLEVDPDEGDVRDSGYVPFSPKKETSVWSDNISASFCSLRTDFVIFSCSLLICSNLVLSQPIEWHSDVSYCCIWVTWQTHWWIKFVHFKENSSIISAYLGYNPLEGRSMWDELKA